MDTQVQSDDLPIKVAEPTAEWALASESERLNSFGSESAVQRLLAWVFLLTGFGFYLFVRRVVHGELPYFVSTSEALVLLTISQAVLFYLYRRMSNDIDVGTGFRRLKTKVPEGVDLPVRIEVLRHGVLTGKDEGFVWLDEGTWYFKGLQTAFRFNQQDVVPIEAWPRTLAPDPGRDKPPSRIPMKSMAGRLELRLNVIDRHEDYAKRKRANAFYRQMYEWLTERPRGGIESLLPPLRVHPGLERRGLVRFEGLAAAFAMVVVDTAVLVGLPRGEVQSGPGSFGATAAVLVAALMAGSIWLAWLETRDLAVRSRLAQRENTPTD